MPDQNQEQLKNWNGFHGERWVTNRETFDRQLASHGGPAMDAAGIGPGMQVIDIGCGFGTTTLEIAQRVGTDGNVQGIDFSTPMIAEARARAAADGITNIRFDEADIQTYEFEQGTADALFSRYGVMFYDDPVRAFTNMHGSLRSSGRLAFVCWRHGEENVWLTGPMKIAAENLELPPPPPPGSPGIFAFAQRDRIETILGQAGFNDISVDELDLTVNVGPDIETAVRNAMNLAPWGQALTSASEATVTKIAEEIGAANSKYLTADGVIIPSASWLVTARR